MTHSFDALGTRWWLTIFDELPTERRAGIFDASAAFVHKFEANYSRFLPDSLVTRLNQERSLSHPPEEFRTLLQSAKQLYLRTDGRFNVLTGHILEARGYDANYSFTDDPAADTTPGNPITDLAITASEITLARGNLDLGGFGKGYVIDQLAQQLATDHAVQYFLINGGGDIYATTNHGEPIEIYLEHPTQPGTSLGTTTLQNEAFAASSPHKRRWPKTATESSETEHTHIIGPLTHDAIFLKAPTATDADAFATTLLQVDRTVAQKLATANQLTIL